MNRTRNFLSKEAHHMAGRRLTTALLTAACGLTLFAAQPAQAQVAYAGNRMIVTGSVDSLGFNTVTIATPDGMVSVPRFHTTFLSDGYTIGFHDLYIGEPIQASTVRTYGFEPAPGTTIIEEHYSNGWYDVNGVFHPYLP
jgi:hypothetical protein